MSCTVDGWSDAQGRKVLALTGHWVSSNWILKDAVMGVQWVVGASTADNIQRVIDNIIGRFQETAEGNLKFVLVCMTSDGESAMTKACVDLLEDANDREYCFGHVAALSIRDVLGNKGTDPQLAQNKELIAKVRRTVAKIKNSKLKSELVANAQFLEHQNLLLPADTRWATEYYMVKRFLGLLPAIDRLYGTVEEASSLETFSDREIEQLEAWVVVLEPIERVIRWSEGEKYLTICHVPEWAADLIQLTRTIPGERATQAKARRQLHQSISTRMMPFLNVEQCPQSRTVFSDGYFHPSGVKIPPCLIAAALHPAYVELECLDVLDSSTDANSLRKLVWQRIEYEAKALTPGPQGPAMEIEGSSTSSDWDSTPKEDHLHSQAFFVRKYMREVKAKILQAGRHPSRLDALQFWKKCGVAFPAFARVAKAFLAVPATSAPCERVFSTCGYLDKKARGRSNMIPSLTFCRRNLKFLGASADEQLGELCRQLPESTQSQ